MPFSDTITYFFYDFVQIAHHTLVKSVIEVEQFLTEFRLSHLNSDGLTVQFVVGLRATAQCVQSASA